MGQLEELSNAIITELPNNFDPKKSHKAKYKTTEYAKNLGNEEIEKLIENLQKDHTWTADVKFGDSLKPIERLEALETIIEHHEAFSKSRLDVGLTDLMEFEIKLKNKSPINVPQHRIPLKEKARLNRNLQRIRGNGVH